MLRDHFNNKRFYFKEDKRESCYKYTHACTALSRYFAIRTDRCEERYKVVYRMPTLS